MKNETKASEPVSIDNEELVSVENLRTKNNTPEYVHTGVCAKMNWKSGKAVTEKEYQAAIEAFLKSPIDGGK